MSLTEAQAVDLLRQERLISRAAFAVAFMPGPLMIFVQIIIILAIDFALMITTHLGNTILWLTPLTSVVSLYIAARLFLFPLIFRNRKAEKLIPLKTYAEMEKYRLRFVLVSSLIQFASFFTVFTIFYSGVWSIKWMILSMVRDGAAKLN